MYILKDISYLRVMNNESFLKNINSLLGQNGLDAYNFYSQLGENFAIIDFRKCFTLEEFFELKEIVESSLFSNLMESQQDQGLNLIFLKKISSFVKQDHKIVSELLLSDLQSYRLYKNNPETVVNYFLKEKGSTLDYNFIKAQSPENLERVVFSARHWLTKIYDRKIRDLRTEILSNTLDKVQDTEFIFKEI